MSTSRQLIAFALLVWTIACLDRFGRIAAWSFLFAQDPRVRLVSADVLWLSLFYTVPVVVFFLLHEGGHWVTAMWHRVPVSGPFFVPVPIAWAAWLGLPAVGTLGAFVRVGGCAPDQRWSIALAGPLAGAWWALACVALGSALSVPGAGYGVYVPHALRAWTDGVIWHPLLFAGYLGVAVTGLNLLPIPFLDGWHLLTTLDQVSGWRKGCTVAAWGCACACLI